MVETESIAEASRQLHIAQPSISVAIKNLEDAFEQQLFIRHHAQGVSLTSSGRRFYEKAKELLRLSYAGESAYQPILSHLIRELGLDLSILHGQIDEIQEQTFGSLAVYASGEAAKIEAAVTHLRASGVQVQIVPSKD